MKKLSCTILILLLLIAASTSYAGLWGESAATSDLSDGRSLLGGQYNPPFSEGGLAGYWPSDFTIQWDITRDLANAVWTYEYTLYANCKDVSHFLLELTQGDGFGDILNPRIQFGDGGWEPLSVEGPRTWDGQNGNSSPGWPDGQSMYGIKFDTGGGIVSYAFETSRDPVWGNFYVKSGKHEGDWVYAYNKGFSKKDFDSDDKLDFIVRPNGGTPPVVPEPASYLLFVAGSGVFAYRRYRKSLEH